LFIAAAALLIQNRHYARLNQEQFAQLITQQQQLQAALGQAATAHQATEVLSTLQAPDTTRFVLTSKATPSQPQIRTFFRPSTGEVVLIASKLPPLSAGKTYELWLISTDGKTTVPACTFTPDAQGNVSAELAHVNAGKPAKLFAVTVERAGGSPVPTSPVVFSGSQGE
jgi:anti-sigma-K factor RskA